MAFFAPYATSVTMVGSIVAGSSWWWGCFIDAIPAMIIFGGLMMPLAEHVHMHPSISRSSAWCRWRSACHAAYGLCLLIACAIGKIEVSDCIKDVAVILVPMLGYSCSSSCFPGDSVHPAAGHAQVRVVAGIEQTREPGGATSAPRSVSSPLILAAFRQARARSNRFPLDGVIFSVVRSYVSLLTRNRDGAMNLVENILQAMRDRRPSDQPRGERER